MRISTDDFVETQEVIKVFYPRDDVFVAPCRQKSFFKRLLCYVAIALFISTRILTELFPTAIYVVICVAYSEDLPFSSASWVYSMLVLSICFALFNVLRNHQDLRVHVYANYGPVCLLQNRDYAAIWAISTVIIVTIFYRFSLLVLVWGFFHTQLRLLVDFVDVKNTLVKIDRMHEQTRMRR